MALNPMPPPASLPLRVNHRPPPTQRPAPCACTGPEVSDRADRVWREGPRTCPLRVPLKVGLLFSDRLISKAWIKVIGMWLGLPIWYSRIRTVPGSQDIWKNFELDPLWVMWSEISFLLQGSFSSSVRMGS